MPVCCLSWETAHLHGETWIAHHRLRHRVFVEREGWTVPSYNGLEHDQFDTPAARYLVWLDQQQEVKGVIRLLPTTRPYMLEVLWPEMVAGSLPRTSAAWEATRFGCDRGLDTALRRRAVAELLAAMQEFGLAQGVRRYLAVMPVRLLEHVVVKAGCDVRPLGPARKIGRFPTVAASLAVSPEVLAEIRRRAALGQPSLGNAVSIAA